MDIATADVVLCGAGIAGITAAYHLSLLRPRLRVVVVDERPPLSLTSDKSTECYRNWWPDPAMVHLVNRSVTWLDRWADETGNAFGLNRRGYLYASTSDDGARRLLSEARSIARLGAGEVRSDSGASAPSGGSRALPAHEVPQDGADYLSDPQGILATFPYLSPETRAVLHVRRAGWFRAQELGTWLLERAEAAGIVRLKGHVTGVETAGGAVCSVDIQTGSGLRRLSTPTFVNAAGPFALEAGRWVGLDLPLSWELHLKVAFRDIERIVPRQAPLLILTDAQRLLWSSEEESILRQTPGDRPLLELLPGGAHLRPEGPGDSPYCLLLWPYHLGPVRPVYPIPPDPAYAEVSMRGMSRLIPGLHGYIHRMPPATVDGGYYTRAPDNLPLIGPTPVSGYFLMAAFSGFGVMAAPGAGELLARTLLGEELPGYARSFLLARFDDPVYQEKLRTTVSTAEL